MLNRDKMYVNWITVKFYAKTNWNDISWRIKSKSQFNSFAASLELLHNTTPNPRYLKKNFQVSLL